MTTANGAPAGSARGSAADAAAMTDEWIVEDGTATETDGLMVNLSQKRPLIQAAGRLALVCQNTSRDRQGNAYGQHNGQSC